MDSVLFKYCPKLVQMFRDGVAVGRSGNSRKISGMSTPNNLAVLRNLFLDIKPKTTLEIGFAFGASGLVLAGGFRESGEAGRSQHCAIDPFQGNFWDEAGVVAFEDERLSDYLDFRCMYSCYALPELIKEGKTFDLIYIDGSHIFEDVFVDFYFGIRLFANGGVIQGQRQLRAYPKTEPIGCKHP